MNQIPGDNDLGAYNQAIKLPLYEAPFLSKYLEIILKEGAGELGVSLSYEMIQMFLVYLKELKEWNQKVNLTSLKKDTAIISKHFIDSLSLVPYIHSKASLLDLGSGAGFPGIPVKIAKPSLKVTLLEAKTSFTLSVEKPSSKISSFASTGTFA